jgi:hypothetical protein
MQFYKIKDRGSITIEAAIVLPVFICVVISLTMLIKLIYIHDIIQHSIDEAANELAAYAYIYHVSGLQRIDDTIKDNLQDNSDKAEDHMGTVVNAFDTLENAYTTGSDFVEDIGSTAESDMEFGLKVDRIVNKTKDLLTEGERLSKEGIETINQLQKTFEEACKDPKSEAESIAWMLSKGIYSDAKTVVAVPLIKYTVRKYLFENTLGNADKAFNKLNIYKNFEGIDFYSSTFFDGDENIDIIAKYKVELPLPVKVLPDIYMVQRSTVRAWLNGGDGVTTLNETSIWDLPNKERGMKIEEIYGGNLPYDFPVIDIYGKSSKIGTSIKSINLNSKSYQDKANLSRLLKQYVDDINSHGAINYKNEEYYLAGKELIFVIPKDSINDMNSTVLEQIKSYAKDNGVGITLSEL